MKVRHRWTTRRSAVVAALGCAAVAVAATGASVGSAADAVENGTATTTVTMRVGAPGIEACAVLFTALDRGFFKKQGLNVRMQVFPNGGAAVSGVIGGSFDAGCTSIEGVAAAASHGVPLRYVAPGALYTSPKRAEHQLIVASSSSIRSARDLNGKTVAVGQTNSLSTSSIQAWMDKNGGDSDSVRFVEMPPPEMAAAVEAGRVDAANDGEPALTAAVQSGKVRVLGTPYTAMGKRFYVTAFFSTKKWADQNAATLDKFQRAMTAARKYSTTHKGVTAKILSKYTKVPVSVISKMHRAEWSPNFDVALLQPVLDTATKYGVLPKHVSAASLTVK